MSDEINAIDSGLINTHDDLVKKTQRFGYIGWFFALLFGLALVVQSLVISLKPVQAVGVVDGVVIGQVVFDEPLLRDMDTITADLKIWLARCISVNKLTIYEDLSVCLNHMTKELGESTLAEYEDKQYAPYVESHGCENTSTSFDPVFSKVVKHENNPTVVIAKLGGDIVCNDGKKRPSQDFQIAIVANLKNKTKTNPLGIEIEKYEDL